MKKTLKAAFPVTVPILTGYIFLGIAYGLLMTESGFGALFTISTSLFIFTGSLQFVGVSFFTSPFNPLNVLLMSLMIDARHIFYGVAMIDKLKDVKKEKPGIIFTLSDETFSVLCNQSPPDGVKKGPFMLTVAVLDYLYWTLGTALGAVFGRFITFNTEGIDFSLTALFVVIFVNQWKESKDHIPAIIGLACSALSLVVFGADNFIVPSMIMIVISLLIYRKPFERRFGAND